MNEMNEASRELKDAEYAVSIKPTDLNLSQLETKLEAYARAVRMQRLALAESKDGVLVGQVID